MKYWIGGVLFLFFDTASKLAAKIYLDGNTLEVIPNFFQLQLAYNYGIAFSLPVPRLAQIFLTLCFFVFFYYWARKYFVHLSSLEKWGCVLIVSGAIGNFWERVLYSRVTDFLSFDIPLPWIGIFPFPIFNVADVCIFGGVCLWIFGAWRNEK